MPRSPQSLAGAIGGLTTAARHDMAERGRAGQKALFGKFEAMVPAEVRDPAERAKKAELLRRAHFAKIAAASAKARRKKARR